MTLSDLLKEVTVGQFMCYVIEHDLDLSNVATFERLQKTEPELTCEYKLEMELRDTWPDEGKMLDIYGVKEGEDEKYRFSFTMDAEYVGHEITQHTLDKFDRWDLIYTAVDEMWWDDATKQTHMDDLNEQMKQLEEGTLKTYSLEEVMEELKSDR